MKQHILLILSSMVSFFIIAPGLLLADGDAASWGTMDNYYFADAQRPAALFDHDLHNEQAALEDDCAVCHHLYENGQLIEDESSEDSLSSDCHGLKKAPDNTVPLRAANHKRCKSCHFSKRKGPVLCGECHINKGRLQ